MYTTAHCKVGKLAPNLSSFLQPALSTTWGRGGDGPQQQKRKRYINPENEMYLLRSLRELILEGKNDPTTDSLIQGRIMDESVLRLFMVSL